MTRPLYWLGRFSARHHWIVIGVWIVLAVALVAISKSAGDNTNNNLTLPGTNSTNATNILNASLPKQANGSNPFALKVTKGKLTDSANKKAINQTVSNLQKLPHIVKVVSPFSSEGSALITKNGQIAYISVTSDENPGSLTVDQAQDVSDAANPARKAGIQAAIGGYIGQKISKPATESSELIGLIAAVIILLFAFGTATAMMLPIVTALIGLACALSVVGLLSHAAQIPTVAPTLATMIGLGVGIDYALFIVTRHKQHINAGMDIQESIARATATSGGAVVFAGTTVVIALVSLAAANIPIVTALGYSAAIAVVTAVLAATTLLPALLGALGPRINSLRVKLGKTHPDDHQPHGWARAARVVADHPWPWMLGVTALLLVLAIPVLNLKLGQQDNGALPKDTATRQSYDIISQGFGPGYNGPMLVAVKFGKPAKPDQNQINKVNQQQQQLTSQQNQLNQQKQQLEAEPTSSQQQQQLDQVNQQLQQLNTQQQQLNQQKQQANSPASDPDLVNLQNAIKNTKGVKSVSAATVDSHGNAAVFTAVATTAPSANATEDLVRNLRDNVIPKAVKGTDLHADVGGTTAAYIDLADKISAALPWIILLVVGLSFLVLVLAFRSLLVPAKAAVCNLLSVGAAYGIVTFIFQEGHGATTLGLISSVPIVSFVPLLMFAILFGLSMDYEVFLMTQIQEDFKKNNDPHDSVVHGLAKTGRVITSAALIMVCVFSSFVLNGDPTVKQFGVGLAAAVAIDATLVRCGLVPAVMVLLGRAAWWLPRWLGRILPKISIEGDEYFAKLDSAVAATTAGGALVAGNGKPTGADAEADKRVKS